MIRFTINFIDKCHQVAIKAIFPGKQVLTFHPVNATGTLPASDLLY